VGQAEPGEISLEEAQGARPYGQGAKNLEDLQSKLSSARTEINAPLNQALDLVGNKHVSGPDGFTTMSRLESQRRQITDQLDRLRNLSPEQQQIELGKGGTLAGLKAKRNAIVDAMTPHLDSTGINSRAIRQQDAQVASTLSRVANRTTLPEEPKPYGIGRMLNIKWSPNTWIGEPAQGLRDIAAGKPLWSGRPTDVNIQQGFSTAGQKPSFAMPRPDFEKVAPGAEFGPAQIGGNPIDVQSVAGSQNPSVLRPKLPLGARLGPVKIGGDPIDLQSVAGSQSSPSVLLRKLLGLNQ
jgi:hypothetical protein